MQRMCILKKNIAFFLVVISVLFIFVSCGFNNHTKVIEKFLTNFKNQKFTESYVYLMDNEESSIFKGYMETVINSQNSENELGKLNKVMLDKIFDFTYEIGEVNENEDGESVKVNVNFKYFELLKAYEGALNDFLTKSLDFENLDNLYSVEYITNLLIEHINKLEKQEKNLEIEVIKDKDWKLVMNRELTEILTANSIKFIDSVKENISIE